MKKMFKNLLKKNMLEKNFFQKSHLEPSDIFIITVPSNKIGKKTRFKAVTVCNISYWKVNKK